MSNTVTHEPKTCPECGGEMQYEHAHAPEPEIGMGFEPAGYCCECGHLEVDRAMVEDEEVGRG